MKRVIVASAASLASMWITCSARADIPVPPEQQAWDWLNPRADCAVEDRCAHGVACDYNVDVFDGNQNGGLRCDKDPDGPLCGTDSASAARRVRDWKSRPHGRGPGLQIDRQHPTQCQMDAAASGLRLECHAESAVYCAPGDQPTVSRRVLHRSRLIATAAVILGLVMAIGLRVRSRRREASAKLAKPTTRG